MRRDLCWIFITSLASLVAIGAIHAEPEIYLKPVITDWIIAGAAVASVAVAKVAADYLKRTLEAAQESNDKLTDQLLSNRARLSCTNLNTIKINAFDDDKINVEMIAGIENFGDSAAFSVRVNIMTSDTPINRTQVLEVMREYKIPVTQTMGRGTCISEKKDSLLTLILDKEYPHNPVKAYRPVWAVVAILYKDIHNRKFLSARGFKIKIEKYMFDTNPTTKYYDDIPFMYEDDVTADFFIS